MTESRAIVGELKRVLEHASAPDRLDEHPWTRSLAVGQKVAGEPALAGKSPGYRLIAALAGLFRETMPSTPPRPGKRLDTRWGQFGILAALYMAPFEFGAVRPASLRDGWGRIDQAIPLFVYGKPGHELPESDLARYRLIADEVETAPLSTISDWHIKGLERLAQQFLNRERYLSDLLGQPSVVLDGSAVAAAGEAPAAGRGEAFGKGGAADRLRGLERRLAQVYQHNARRLWATAAILAALFFLWKGWRIYDLTLGLREAAGGFQALAETGLEAESIVAAGEVIATARRDAAALRAEAGPFLWLGPAFAWLPVYGPDLAAARDILDLAVGLTAAADEAYRAGLPLWQATQSEGARPKPSELLDLLVSAQPGFEAASGELDRALAARALVDVERLSPRTRHLIEAKIDPYLPLLQDGIAAARAAPRLLGAAGHGPQTYLILLQNEDELRATGGFITAVGAVTVERGELLSFSVEDSYAVDDLDKPYPAAPWQLDRYMHSHIWLLRDSNWSPDFPTAAALAEHLYAYTRFHSADGVIAIDQQAIRLLLQAIGPLEVEGAAGPVTADNVIDFMRSAKAPQTGEALDQEWWRGRKDFMRQLADAMLARLQGEAEFAWVDLASAAVQALDERHVLVQVDDPTAAAVLAHRGWDGAVRPGPGDFLMVVDSNLGFNKANAAVETELAYAVDLSSPEAPAASLTVTHRNPTSGQTVCKHAPDYGAGAYADMIARCYWDYLRVYTLSDTTLLEAAPQAVPGEWMIRGETVPAQVDELDDERLEGVRGFGTLLVAPLGGTVETAFRFSLPPAVLTADRDGRAQTYRLRVQKQPGTLAVPLALSVRLPNGAQLVGAEPAGQVDQDVWRVAVVLSRDTEVSLTFSRR